MITYRMMDETCLLPSCLHGGPVPLASLQEALTTAAWAEREYGLPPGALARFLQALCRRYGSAAVLAVEDNLVVGKLRFAPVPVEQMLSGVCYQQAAESRRIAAFDPDTLPAREDLARRELRLECYQVASGPYHGRGIAKGLLDTALAWARETGWEAVSSSAIRHIPPLLAWSGMASEKALRDRGFVVVSETTNDDLREVVASQRAGQHGEQVQRQWAGLADVSEDDAAVIYEMTLELRG